LRAFNGEAPGSLNSVRHDSKSAVFLKITAMVTRISGVTMQEMQENIAETVSALTVNGQLLTGPGASCGFLK
jgi:hypothetical protein